MDKIKPCPFCGGEAFVATVEHPPENRPNGYRFHGQIMCRNCQASAGTTGFDLAHEEATRKAIAAWNRRADAVPVVRGEWIQHHETTTDNETLPYGWECSLCGRWEMEKQPFCNCSAKMEDDK